MSGNFFTERAVRHCHGPPRGGHTTPFLPAQPHTRLSRPSWRGGAATAAGGSGGVARGGASRISLLGAPLLRSAGPFVEFGRRGDAARRRRLSRAARHGVGLQLRAPGWRRRGLPRTRGEAARGGGGCGAELPQAGRARAASGGRNSCVKNGGAAPGECVCVRGGKAPRGDWKQIT